jgi:ZIP family zinc transporter
LIGLSLITSACVGWFTLRSLPADWIGFVTALGAGAIFYLAVTNLLIEAEENQFQQSGGLAAAAGYIAMLLLTEVA